MVFIPFDSSLLFSLGVAPTIDKSPSSIASAVETSAYGDILSIVNGMSSNELLNAV